MSLNNVMAGGVVTHGPEADNRSNRACLECRRKKTKCDMRKPVCGLCKRTDSSCNFPTKRKTPEWRKRPIERDNQRSYKQKFERLMQLLESRVCDQNDIGVLTAAIAAHQQSDDDRNPNPSPDTPCSAETSFSLATPPPPQGDPSPPPLPTALPQHHHHQSPQPPPPHNDPHAYFLENQQRPDSGPGSLPRSEPNPEAEVNVTSRTEKPSQVPSSQSRETESIDIPRTVADQLIRAYFDSIQAWLALLHRPWFYARYMSRSAGVGGPSLVSLDGYTLEEALLLNAMFALAARYCSSPYLGTAPPPDRGRPFAEKAIALYDRARLQLDEPNLMYLQGCVLLAFYQYTSGPCHRGWILSGVCVRIAYDLGLCDVDEADDDDDDDDDNGTEVDAADPEAWARQEERRRAWWLVWELDTFGSSMSRRPSMIDRRRMAVRLPVSDEAWFAVEPVQSAILRKEPAESWKSLLGSPNQDARAWFLVANYLMSLPFDTLQGREPVSEPQREALANAIACFALALPPHLRLESSSFYFDDANFSRCNWIAALHIMLVSARAGLEALYAAADTALQPRAMKWSFRCRELSRILCRWDPQYISLCQPFVACQLLPVYFHRQPSSITDVAADADADDAHQGPPYHHDILMLALGRHAEMWRLGTILLQLDKIVKARENALPESPALAKNFAVYFPSPKKKSGTSPSSSKGSSSYPESIARYPPTVVPSNQSQSSGVSPFPLQDATRLAAAAENHHGTTTLDIAQPSRPLDLPALGCGMSDIMPDNNPGLQNMNGLEFQQDDWLPDRSGMYDAQQNLDFFRWYVGIK